MRSASGIFYSIRKSIEVILILISAPPDSSCQRLHLFMFYSLFNCRTGQN